MSTAIIYEGPEGVPVRTGATTIVGTSAERIVAVADELADTYERIELCGATGPRVHRAVRDVVADRARVGVVMYGFESLEAVADFKRGFAAGEERTGAFLHLRPGADPGVERVHEAGSTFVAVPDEETASTVAAELAADGATLIELYGGLGTTAAAAVADATDRRHVAVGLAVYED